MQGIGLRDAPLLAVTLERAVRVAARRVFVAVVHRVVVIMRVVVRVGGRLVVHAPIVGGAVRVSAPPPPLHPGMMVMRVLLGVEGLENEVLGMGGKYSLKYQEWGNCV